MSADSSHRPFQVRAGSPSDMPAVHALIVELATYEKSPAEVTLTVSQLAADAREGCFEVTVAEGPQGQIVGMALHHLRYSTWKGRTWYLEDLVVTEPWRSKGVGRALFEAVAQRALERDAQRLEWQVLDWNAPAIGFYERLGASLDGSWMNGRWTRQDLERFESQPRP